MSARIKGAAIADFLSWMTREKGEATVRAAWLRLPESARVELGDEQKKLMPFRWYSAASVNALVDAFTAHLPRDEQITLAREGTRAIVEHTLRGLYGSMFRLLVNPSRYLDRVQTVWSLFHDTGSITGSTFGPREHITRLSRWQGRHPFVVRLNAAFAQALYESMGCRGVLVDATEEVDADGGIVDVLHIRWMEGPT